jgi:fluoroquinolone transport system permease protein
MVNFKTLRALSTLDAISVGRDSLLRGMVLVPLGLAVAARWLLPPAIAALAGRLPFDLAALYPHLMSYVLLLLPPAICGMVVGFILLDQRDDHTLTALRVTPLPLTGYLIYRLAAPMLLGLGMTLIALPLAGLLPLGPLELLGLALAAAPLAPLTALFLAAFAANKVQGFALQKALGLFLIAPFLGAVLPPPWQVVLWLVPTYWPAALLGAIPGDGVLLGSLLVGGLVYQGVLLGGLVRRFTRLVYQ